MVFDGRFYAGASPISPILYHAKAPATGELCASALRAAYFFAQHQASLIGSQTYTQRMRRHEVDIYLLSTTMQRVAEWPAVHLAAHHTHVTAEIFFQANPFPVSSISARLVITDNASTVTGQTVTTDLGPETVFSLVNFRPVFRLQMIAPIGTLSLPTEAARVYIEASATSLGAAALAITPLVATAWREVQP